MCCSVCNELNETVLFSNQPLNMCDSVNIIEDTDIFLICMPSGKDSCSILCKVGSLSINDLFHKLFFLRKHLLILFFIIHVMCFPQNKP